MGNDELKSKVNAVIAEVFQMEEAEIRGEMTQKDIASWDSFNHVRLGVVLENDLGIRLDNSDLLAVKKIEDIYKLAIPDYND